LGTAGAGRAAFYRARRNAGQIKAIAYYEAIVLPRRWEDYTGGCDILHAGDLLAVDLGNAPHRSAR
jgi:hypothetical protein